MEKTKLGISVGLLGAITFFSCLLLGGEFSLITVIVAGYILIAEENVWLKKIAVKAVALMVFFAAVSALLALIPGAIRFIDSVLGIFGGGFRIPFIESIIDALQTALDLIATVLFLILGIKALKQTTIRIPVIDDVIGKYIN